MTTRNKITTVREEIANYLESNQIIINDSLDYHTNEIIKMIEKRIDERKTFVEKKWFGYHTILSSKLEELLQVKEMLRK